MHNFEDSWGAMHAHMPPAHIPKSSETALLELQEKPKSKLTGWLSDLIECAPAQAREGRIDTWLPKRNALIERSQLLWIGSLFKELEGFAQEFNRSTAAEHLTVVSQTPRTIFSLPCRRDPSYAPYKFTCYEGHLAAHNFMLLIRSYYECLQIFILPSDMLLGLETDHLASCDVPPLAELRPAVNDDLVDWALKGVPVDREMIPVMARELFADFIKLCLGTITEAELLMGPKRTKANQPAVTASKQRTQDEEILSGVLKDLQLWQARNLFSTALREDTKALLRVDPVLDSNQEIGEHLQALRAQYSELQACFDRLHASLTRLSELSLASNDEQSGQVP